MKKKLLALITCITLISIGMFFSVSYGAAEEQTICFDDFSDAQIVNGYVHENGRIYKSSNDGVTEIIFSATEEMGNIVNFELTGWFEHPVYYMQNYSAHYSVNGSTWTEVTMNFAQETADPSYGYAAIMTNTQAITANARYIKFVIPILKFTDDTVMPSAEAWRVAFQDVKIYCNPQDNQESSQSSSEAGSSQSSSEASSSQSSSEAGSSQSSSEASSQESTEFPFVDDFVDSQKAYQIINGTIHETMRLIKTDNNSNTEVIYKTVGNIGSFKLTGWFEHPLYYDGHFMVYTSTDGNTWNNVALNYGDSYADPVYGFSGVMTNKSAFGPGIKYIKFVIPVLEWAEGGEPPYVGVMESADAWRTQIEKVELFAYSEDNSGTQPGDNFSAWMWLAAALILTTILIQSRRIPAKQ